MPTNKEEWYDLAVKKSLALSIGITSKHEEGFHCLNGLHSFTQINLNHIHRVCDFSTIVIPSDDTKIL